jgi:hypothetical protein
MSAQQSHQRGKLEFAGALADLVAQIEREREGDTPSRLSYLEWLQQQASRQDGAA